MIPSEYGSSAPTSAKSVAEQVRDDDAPAVVDLGPLERARKELELGELDRLVDAVEDVVHVDAGLEQLGRQPVALGVVEYWKRPVSVTSAT